MQLFFQVLAAFIGTVAFSVLFQVPLRQWYVCGAGGAIGWFIYLKLEFISPAMACFVATLVISLFARIFAIIRKVPSNVFLLSGIFPILPGIGIYNTIYSILTRGNDSLDLAYRTLSQVGAIVLAIIIVFSLPIKKISLRKKGRSDQ